MTLAQLRPLLDRQKTNHSLEQAFYLDPEIFALEMRQIWRTGWLMAGSTAEIPRAGDFFTWQIGSDNLVIIRGNGGEIFAHHNSCRHRGSLICLEERGHAARLICPYHQWVYEKNGSLLKARQMPDDFEKEKHGLAPAHVRTVGGFIFVSLAAGEAPDFEPIRRDFEPFLAPFEMEKARVAHRATYVLRTNWKLVAENFRECYHCGPAHPEYCGAVVGANMLEDAAATLAAKTPIWQQKGLTTDGVPFAGGAHFAVRYPLREGIKSYSLDGLPTVAMPMGRHGDWDAGVLGMVALPNWWMDAVADYMWSMRLTAVSPSETRIDLTWLVDEKAVEGVDYDLVRLAEFWKITGEQDWRLCENNFRGIESSAYRPGPYAPAEAEVWEFIEWYLAKMRG